MPSTTFAPVTAVVLSKNEEAAIARCLRALDFCDQIIVVDSHSTDRTAEIAHQCGAEVLLFTWNGQYPKKKQWGMQHSLVRNDWVLHLDADEIVTPELASEIASVATTDHVHAAFDVPLAYHFMGRRLRHGHRVTKRSLVDRRRVRFPEVGDLNAPGITEVEGHYQPQARGTVGRLRHCLIHDDPDPLSDWIARHNRYSDWESYLLRHPDVKSSVRSQRSGGGQLFDLIPFKPAIFFLYAYVLRLGFLDGRPGFDYAYSLSWYYWSIGAKARDAARSR